MTEELRKLAQKAKAAWSNSYECTENRKAFRDATTPDVVLGLLDSLDAARAEVIELHQNQERNLQTLEGNRSTIDQLRAESETRKAWLVEAHESDAKLRAELERHKVTLRTMSEWSDKLEARLAELEKQEPIGEVVSASGYNYLKWKERTSLGLGAKVYLAHGAAPTPQAQRLTEAFDAGFRCAAGWAQRDDLFSDIDSPTYKKDRSEYLGRIAEKNGINLGE